MKQPIHTSELDENNIELSSARQDRSGAIKMGENLKKGTILEIDGDEYKRVTDKTKANAVLLEDTDATTVASTAPLLIGGTVDEDMLIFDTANSITADDVREVLRDKNIYLKKRSK